MTWPRHDAVSKPNREVTDKPIENMTHMKSVNDSPTLCWSTTDQCHRADMVCEFSCCREVNSARHCRKYDARSLVSSSQTHWRRSSCLRWLNMTYSRHLVNEVDSKWLLCRTTARSNFRRATIAVSRATYQRCKVLRSVPRINDDIIALHRLHTGTPSYLAKLLNPYIPANTLRSYCCANLHGSLY